MLYIYYANQYNSERNKIFGSFSDSLPDRWGRRLIDLRYNSNLKEAFAKPYSFKKGLFLLQFIKLSKNRTKTENVIFKPNSEEDFLTYMEENKEQSINIIIPTNKKW